MVAGPSVEVVSDVAGMDALREEWDALHADARGTVFQTFTWLRTWWDIYGHRGDGLHIVTARINGQLAAILPMYRQRSGFGPLRLVRLRLIGVYETYGEYEILAAERFGRDAVHAIARHLAGLIVTGEVDLVAFFRFSPQSAPMATLIDALRLRELRSRVVTHVITRVVMDLPATWEAYLANLTPNERQSLRRKIRHYEAAGVTVERVSCPDHRAFEDYVRLHTLSWEERRIRGYFASPHFRQFLERVTNALTPGGRARLYFLAKDGVRFAAVHAFFVNGTCCFYLSGLDRTHPLVTHSPGKVLLARVIREAIDEGCSVFDFQGGDEYYKFQLGGRSTSFAKGLFWRGGIASWKVVGFLTAQYVVVDLRWRMRERILPVVRRATGRPIHVRGPGPTGH